mgnify:CR=1 FL=1
MRLRSLEPPRCRRCGTLVSGRASLCHRCSEGLRLLVLATVEPAIAHGATVEQLAERLFAAVLGYLEWERLP